jgi:hypothetical protein
MKILKKKKGNKNYGGEYENGGWNLKKKMN